MEDRANLGQAHADTLAGEHDPAPRKVLGREEPMPRARPVRDDDALVLPVPQHVRSHADLGGRLPDPHAPIMTP